MVVCLYANPYLAVALRQDFITLHAHSSSQHSRQGKVLKVRSSDLSTGSQKPYKKTTALVAVSKTIEF